MIKSGCLINRRVLHSYYIFLYIQHDRQNYNYPSFVTAIHAWPRLLLIYSFNHQDYHFPTYYALLVAKFSNHFFSFRCKHTRTNTPHPTSHHNCLFGHALYYYPSCWVMTFCLPWSTEPTQLHSLAFLKVA